MSNTMFKNQLRKLAKAFTLVELIVVITILAILATVGFLTLSGYTDDARSATVAANVRTVYSAILTESTTSGNSPRYYVDHDPAAALSGGIVFVEGVPVVLTGGQWGSGGTNYSAGNPRWDRLRMNGEKFRLSAVMRGGLGGGNGAVSGVLPGLAYEAGAAYDTGAVSVGAFDYVGKAGVSGKARTAAYFQVAGVSPGTKKASVTGNYTAVGTGAVAGLVRDPSLSSSTGAVVEAAAVDYSKTSFSCSGLPSNAAYYGGATTYSVPSGTSTAAAYAATPAVNTCQFSCAGGNTWNGSACVAATLYFTGNVVWGTQTYIVPLAGGAAYNSATAYVNACKSIGKKWVFACSASDWSVSTTYPPAACGGSSYCANYQSGWGCNESGGISSAVSGKFTAGAYSVCGGWYMNGHQTDASDTITFFACANGSTTTAWGYLNSGSPAAICVP